MQSGKKGTSPFTFSLLTFPFPPYKLVLAAKMPEKIKGRGQVTFFGHNGLPGLP